jgi:hypothetical protein
VSEFNESESEIFLDGTGVWSKSSGTKMTETIPDLGFLGGIHRSKTTRRRVPTASVDFTHMDHLEPTGSCNHVHLVPSWLADLVGLHARKMTRLGLNRIATQLRHLAEHHLYELHRTARGAHILTRIGDTVGGSA